MPSFSDRSLAALNTCHADLVELFTEVIKHWDCTVLCGHRDKAAQDEAYRTGHSMKPWPESKHNQTPSLAVDVAPYPINWEDWERFYAFAGFVLGVATMLHIPIRSGLDWDSDRDLHDQTFMDSPHFELTGVRWPDDRGEIA
jgi:peptidoglycan L-alanyl-D-glutamate endopeptidase CwlK